jgi:hypothetical protein
MIYYGRIYELTEILDSIDRVKARDIRILANKIFVGTLILWLPWGIGADGS